MPTFSPPTETIGYPVDPHDPMSRLFARFRGVTRGINVWKLADGTYTQNQPEPYEDGFVIEYLGGHVYLVDDDEAAALTAAGYTVS